MAAVRPYAASRGFAGRLFVDRPERARVQHRVSAGVWWLGNVSVLVIPCIRTGEPLQALNQAGLWGSLLPAAWSYCLAARARGLENGMDEGVLIPTAHYTGETFHPAPREPLETVLHLDQW